MGPLIIIWTAVDGLQFGVEMGGSVGASVDMSVCTLAADTGAVDDFSDAVVDAQLCIDIAGINEIRFNVSVVGAIGVVVVDFAFIDAGPRWSVHQTGWGKNFLAST